MGVCLDNVGDTIHVQETSKPGIKITKIIGQDLPLEAAKNVAGVAGLALLEDFGLDKGFQIQIEKGIKPGSGIGSSSASAAGAVVGINHLLGNPYTREQLITFAMEGERVACGTAHADNVSPVLLGGFTLVRSANPLDVITLNSPLELVVTIIHPEIEVKTADARAVLLDKLHLKQAIAQTANLGALVTGLFKDYELIRRSLVDHIVEPVRSMLIPGFELKIEQTKLVHWNWYLWFWTIIFYCQKDGYRSEVGLAMQKSSEIRVPTILISVQSMKRA